MFYFKWINFAFYIVNISRCIGVRGVLDISNLNTIKRYQAIETVCEAEDHKPDTPSAYKLSCTNGKLSHYMNKEVEVLNKDTQHMIYSNNNKEVNQ